MDIIEKLLLENKAWAAEKITDDPKFFKRLVNIQKPDFLWIGCSDSRVPANEIIGAQPGEVFVHRNVANLVVKDDLNLLTVLEYAIKYLNIKHVIICGHYGCGGVAAANSNQDFGLINHWLKNIKKTKEKYSSELNKIKDEKTTINRLVELNVVEQIKALSELEAIKNSADIITLHGWVYDLHDGLIRTICRLENK